MTGTALTLAGAEKTLVHYNRARTELAEAKRIDEVKNIRDYAMAAKVYARQAQDKTMLADATEIKLRAERRAGEMLITMEKNGERATRAQPKGTKVVGAKGSKGLGGKRVLPSGAERTTLSDLGITVQQSSDWQKLARTPEKQFEKVVREAKAGRKKPAPIKRDWPDGEAPKPEFDRQVFLFGARDALEIGQTVLDDIAEADFPNYGELFDAAQKVVDIWKTVLVSLKTRKDKTNGT